MAKYVNEIAYNIKTTLDSSGISKLQSELRLVESELQRLGNQRILNKDAVSGALSDIGKLRTALNSSFNSKIGMLDMSKFTDSLKTSNVTVGQLEKSMSQAGSVGRRAFVDTIGVLGKFDNNIKSVSKTTDKMFNTLGNTVRWGVVASGFQSILNSAHQAVSYVKELDESLTNIMMVTAWSSLSKALISINQSNLPNILPF